MASFTQVGPTEEVCDWILSKDLSVTPSVVGIIFPAIRSDISYKWTTTQGKDMVAVYHWQNITVSSPKLLKCVGFL